MEERGNKTIMSGVLFLDIVEYSRKSVAGQISLKDRFNSYLSAAIHDVPVSDRIILDTGDGAAFFSAVPASGNGGQNRENGDQHETLFHRRNFLVVHGVEPGWFTENPGG